MVIAPGKCFFASCALTVCCITSATVSTHDSQVFDCRDLQTKLEDVYESTEGNAVANSAYCRSSYRFFIKAAHDEIAAEGMEATMRLRHASVARPSTEWGICAFKAFSCAWRTALTTKEMINKMLYLQRQFLWSAFELTSPVLIRLGNVHASHECRWKNLFQKVTSR